jgi:PAS domain S-box-containing protein
MRRVLWVPVEGKGELRGVLLAGSRQKQASFSKEAMESVASKLARAMELAEEQRSARQWPAGEPAGAQPAGLRQERSDAELHSVIEWLEEGVVLFDAQENVRAMNTRFAEIAGLTAEEAERSTTLERLIGCLAGRAAEPQGFAERWRELARNLEGGIREELQMARPAPRVLERTARPVLDAAGRRAGWVEIYRDCTAQQLMQSKLPQVEKLAALGQRVTGIAHELSNPLASILGYAQRLLLREDAAGKSEEARIFFRKRSAPARFFANYW